MAQIAEAARVAANTVYTSAGGKPQLLTAITEGGTGRPDAAETLACRQPSLARGWEDLD